MPMRSASRRIDKPSGPSSSSSSSATSAISRARGLGSLTALEAIVGPQPIAECTIEGDMEAPGESADEKAGGDQAERGEYSEQEWPPEAVPHVVEADGARVKLAL